MATELPTVRVRNWKPGARSIGVINAQDFNPKIHELVENDEEQAGETAPVDTEFKAPQRRRKVSGG